MSVVSVAVPVPVREVVAVMMINSVLQRLHGSLTETLNSVQLYPEVLALLQKFLNYILVTIRIGLRSLGESKPHTAPTRT